MTKPSFWYFCLKSDGAFQSFSWKFFYTSLPFLRGRTCIRLVGIVSSLYEVGFLKTSIFFSKQPPIYKHSEVLFDIKFLYSIFNNTQFKQGKDTFSVSPSLVLYPARCFSSPGLYSNIISFTCFNCNIILGYLYVLV